jgi:hypothetical protein
LNRILLHEHTSKLCTMKPCKRRCVTCVVWLKIIHVYHCIMQCISLPKLKSACPGTSLHHGYYKIGVCKKIVQTINYSKQEKHIIVKLSCLITGKEIWYLRCLSAHQDSEHSWYSTLYVQTAKYLRLIKTIITRVRKSKRT